VVPADPKRTALLAQAVEEVSYPVERLPSDAGHDAAAVAKIAPIAMLFVRCLGGIRHNPAESVEPEDVAVAIEVTSHFLELLAEAPGAEPGNP
jgi:allantoate deiminase